MRYVEFCAGIGGTRSGLDAAGWRCVLAIDHDQDAVEVHRLTHGDAVLADVTTLSDRDIPPAEVWVAGFPCQPFSSSGKRLGFGHVSGNVFEHLARLAAKCAPPFIVLENVEGLLTNKSGHTFATILYELTRLGYEVDWLLMDLRWFDVPQSRPRLFVVAAAKGAFQVGHLEDEPGMLPGIGPSIKSVFGRYLKDRMFSWSVRSRGEIHEVVKRMQPEVGKRQHRGPRVFGKMGHASGDEYVSFDVSAPLRPPKAGALAEIVAPSYSNPNLIRSARYWSPKGGGGSQGLHIRCEPLSHCVGTSLGGAPLFAVSAKSLRGKSDRAAFLRFSNWHREQDGLLVMRLTPERAVLLFGPHTAALSEALAKWEVGATRKFKLIGNMVAPVCAKEIATIVEQHAAEKKMTRSLESIRGHAVHTGWHQPATPLE
jgi:DNA-cytosine methyltransferase